MPLKLSNNKKRLLFLIPTLNGGGAERVISHIVNALNRKKFSIALVVCDLRGPMVANILDDVELYDLKKRNKWGFHKQVINLKIMINKWKPDVLISFTQYANILAIIVSKIVTRNIRVIINERNNPSQYTYSINGGFLLRFFIRYFYKISDLIITNSIGSKNALQNDFFIPKNKLLNIYNPIDDKYINVLKTKKLSHPFYNDGNIVLIGVGRLMPQKRFDLLIKAFAIIKNDHKNVFLILLGEGGEKEKLFNLARSKNISDSIDFIGYQSNPFAWISKSDIFILTSDYEGLPNVLLEAMSCGTPIISTNCPSGPSEIIKNGFNGLLVPTNNVDLLVKAIHKLIIEKDTREKFIKNGFKKLKLFKKEKIINEIENVYLK